MPGGKEKSKGSRESAKENSIFSGSGAELVGKTIDRFEIVELLGQGSLSIAYKAWDKQNRTTVILKVVHKHLLPGIKNFKKFVESRLISPCIKGSFTSITPPSQKVAPE